MKPAITFSIICLIVAFIFSGCGKSNEQIKKVGALQLELFQIQQQLYSQMSELSKVAWQIEAIANRRDQIAMGMASDVHTAQGLITAAFKASEDEGMQPKLLNDSDEMVKKLEVDIDMLKNAIDKAQIAVVKSRDVIVAYNKKQTQKNK
jgi:hypothetical protein